MREYEITIRETLEKTVTVEAESRDDAIYLAERLWKDGYYILGSEEFVGVDFEEKKTERSRDEGR